jgi:hypothetical protein
MSVNQFWRGQRERVAEWGLSRTLSYYVFGVAAHKVGVKIWDDFEYPLHAIPLTGSRDATSSVLESMADWTSRDLELLQEHQSISLLPLYPGFFARGDRCVVARWKGSELACVCWAHPTSEYVLAPGVPGFLIQYCFTLPEHRGKGLYPQTLASACSYLRDHCGWPVRIFVDCSTFNYASKRGILKAGFKPIGRTITAFTRTWGWPSVPSPNSPQPNVVNAH